MLYTIYQLKEQLNDLYLIYSTVLQDYPEEPIAVSQQRKMQLDPSFPTEMIKTQFKFRGVIGQT